MEVECENCGVETDSTDAVDNANVNGGDSTTNSISSLCKVHELPLNSSKSFYQQLSLSPDGTMALASLDNNFVHTYWTYSPVAADSDNMTDEQQTDNKSNFVVVPAHSHDVGESVYDIQWFPQMSLSDPWTCCYLTTAKDHPIQLWDSNYNTLRATYVGHNSYDELDTAISLSFNLQGDKIYAGSQRMIRCFDVSEPGKNYTNYPTCRNRNDSSGQKGLISTISFNPDRSGAFACGSYAASIGVYVENESDSVLEIRDLDIGGVTCTKWSPCGNRLWAGGRQTSDLVCWDLRNLRCEIGRVKRNLRSNQRIWFDLDQSGCHLVTGSQDGELLVYEAQTSMQLLTSISGLCHENSNTPLCVNSARFHPTQRLIGVSTGQRCYDSGDSDSDSDIDDSDNHVNFHCENTVTNTNKGPNSAIQFYRY